MRLKKLSVVICLLFLIGCLIISCDENTDKLPELTGTVSITGTTEVGQTLTANISNLGGSGVITFQWMRGGNTVIGSDNVYIVQSTDVGTTITVTVTRSDNSGSVTSKPTAVISPIITGNVTISGIPEVGQRLTANTSGLDNSGKFSYQWLCAGTVINNANLSTYTVQLADAGSSITVSVTSTGISGSVISLPTEIIPQPTVEIQQNVVVGDTLTAITNNLAGLLSYQWKRDGANIAGTNNTNYIVQFTDIGSTITVTVTCAGVLGNGISASTSIISQPIIIIPLNPVVGQTLTASTNNLNGTLSYQWKRGTTNVGTNSSSYTILFSDVGSTLTVTVSLTGISGNAISSSTDIIPQPAANIIGKPSLGETLTVITNNLDGDLSYQWKRGTLNIGTNIDTYTIQTADIGSILSVNISRIGITGNITSALFEVSNTGIGIEKPTIKLFLDGNLIENSGVTTINHSSGTFNVSITSDTTYSDIVWYLNGSIISQGSSRRSIVLSKQTPVVYQVIVEATLINGIKNSGNHIFIIQ